MYQVNIKIVDSDDKLVDEYIIKRKSINSAARQSALNNKLLKSDLPKYKSDHMFACAAIAVCLYNKKGELVYPEPKGDEEDTCIEEMYDNIDPDLFDILSAAYLEVNPLTPTLTSKKKKS